MSRRTTWTIRALVLGGLAVCAVASVAIKGSTDGLPGVALGSPALLALERTLAFFVGWVLVVLIAAEAWRGRLPLEVSGRGVRYADAPTSQTAIGATDAVLERMDDEIALLRREVVELRALPRRGNKEVA
jgi:hypothetical protein